MLKIFILKILRIIPDKLFNTILFIKKLKYFPKFKKPRSFNEKINYIKLYSRNQLREIVADRIKVRKYVENKNTSCKLIPLLWEGKYFNKEVYDSLPNKFVIKANHGSKMVKIVDKNRTNYFEVNNDIKNG